MKKDETTVTVTGAEEIPTEIIASAIIKVSEAAARLEASGLNRSGLLVLLKHTTGLHMSEIGRVLDALPKLATLYVLPKKPSDKPRRTAR